jgi:hypothetical protein
VFGLSDSWLLDRAIAGLICAHFLAGESWIDPSSVSAHLDTIRRRRPPYRNPRTRPTRETIARLDAVLGGRS